MTLLERTAAVPECLACKRSLPEDAYVSRRRYCGTTCRVKAHRARLDLRRDLAFDLLLAQTRAVLAGDTAALAAITEAASRLLPAA